MKRQIASNDAFWIIVMQAACVFIMSVLLWFPKGSLEAGSFAAGGVICVLPSIYLYRRVFAHQGARAAKKIFKSLYWGEMVKVLLTAMGFGLAVTTDWVVPIWLFMGYIAAQLSFGITSVVLGVLKFHYNQKMRTE
ncbi:MAG: ATP synthase subunit I [Proteobacteria bacterium]|nr:ATP synthase subunit I [Pseudomonadota bacterium]